MAYSLLNYIPFVSYLIPAEKPSNENISFFGAGPSNQDHLSQSEYVVKEGLVGLHRAMSACFPTSPISERSLSLLLVLLHNNRFVWVPLWFAIHMLLLLLSLLSW